MPRERGELFSERVAAGSRTYFFDVKRSSDGTTYLTISESRRGRGDSYEHNRVMVFGEHLDAFRHGLEKAVEFIAGGS